MKNNFRVISVCSLMAAFAASSWAACPSGSNWSADGEDCVYKMPASGSENTLPFPDGLTSFKLKYDGTYDVDDATLFVDLTKSGYALRVTGSATLADGGALTISNRITGKPWASENMLLGLIAFNEGDMFTCSVDNCKNIKETGFNALAINFAEGIEGIGSTFDLTLTLEKNDFGPLQVYYIKEVTEKTMNSAISTATMYHITLPFPAEKLQQAVNAGYEKVAILEGSSKWELNIPADIDVNYAYLNRTFPDVEDARSTIALPFSFATDHIYNAWEIWQFTRVGEDPKNPGYDAVFMKKVFCVDPEGDYCPAKNGTLEAYKPYIIQLEEGATSLEFDGDVKLEKTPTKEGFADFTCQNNSNWVFRGIFKNYTWTTAPENVYGYAGSGDYVGQFVKVGKNVSINPFRAILTTSSASPIAPANSSYALRQNVLPDEMNIVIEGDNNETTVIGSFNTRTGEMKFINNMKHTYDLKGRRVNGTNNARGAYYGKKVLMK